MKSYVEKLILACKAERETTKSLLIESNSSRERSAEYMENLVHSQNKVQKLQEELKKVPLN